ncbi:MAG: alpha/beta hydrolase [Acidaminococcus sp.]|jgi:fermentation-respiration switch protein FrsA (DUF1100 family)|nr:alpha/beta hydrolase [Acidaminococcus sp.]MCI2115355.1 alpha/beta hydrolase [Acidaminococcus sp.]MCI2117419.1 alpha/beta hydrolase [Acidaminococcus sp.]
MKKIKLFKKVAAGFGAAMILAAVGMSGTAKAAQSEADWFAPLPTVTPAPQHADHGADNFYKSTQVTETPVTFKNQFNMDVAGNLYIPKSYKKGQKLPAIIVGHPMGAVKEQSGTLYAQKMAEHGFITLAIDTPFWGSSAGEPRNSVLPDLYSEAWMAAVDYLGTRDFVDRDNIGGIGICGSGSFLISAAKIDPRIKAVATVSMYNMGAANRNGLNHSQTLAQREAYIADAAQRRYEEFQGAPHKLMGGTTHTLQGADEVQQEFYDFYRTTRGAAHGKGQDMNTTTHPTYTSNVKFMNFYPFEDIETISPRPMLFITGDHAHSKEFSEDAYRRAKEPKELYYVKGAGHVDLYDKTELIPFDKLNDFFSKNLHKTN